MFVVALALGGALGVLLFRPKTAPAPSQPPAANSPARRALQPAPPPARLESLTVAPEPAPSTPPAALPAETGAPAAAAAVERQAPPEAAAKTTPPAEAAAAAAALRPSFDCRYAHTGAERIVCGDSALAAADRRLAQAYRNAVRSGVPESQLRQTQGDWLVQRENAAPDRAALDAMYDRRIQELENLAR